MCRIGWVIFPDWVTYKKATDRLKTRTGGQENRALLSRYRHRHPSLQRVQKGKTNGREGDHREGSNVRRRNRRGSSKYRFVLIAQLAMRTRCSTFTHTLIRGRLVNRIKILFFFFKKKVNKNQRRQQQKKTAPESTKTIYGMSNSRGFCICIQFNLRTFFLNYENITYW